LFLTYSTPTNTVLDLHSRSRTASPNNSDRDEEAGKLQPACRDKRTTRRAPTEIKKPSDDLRRLVKLPARLPNEAEDKQENDDEIEDDDDENEEEPSPGEGVEDQEIELRPAHSS
jgi:hypothetical protein